MKTTTWNRRSSISKLNTIIDGQLDAYTYKLCRYSNDLQMDLRNTSEYNFYFGNNFDLRTESDLLRSPSTNVIKSVIDSLVSKLGNNTVRPFFTPIDSNFRTKQIVREAQHFFDGFFDSQDVHSKISYAFKSAAIFDKGYIWVNPITFEIETLPTWCVAMLNSEQTFGNKRPTKLLVKYTNFPTTKLKESGVENKVVMTTEYCDYAIYVDLDTKEVATFINGKENSTSTYNADVLPIVTIFYNKPIFGARTISIVDELEGIQTQIDLINSKISACSQLTPGNVTFVNEGSSLDASSLNNRDGGIYRLDMPPGVNELPVKSVTPAPFDPMWQNLLDFYTQKAYDMVGISQLSAQSKKPSGLDSGAALQTMEDIESDRFETQTKNYIEAYVDLTKIMVDVLPDDAPVLPDGGITWKEIKEQTDLFNIQYSAASALSKDPAEKVKQILQMSQAGLIPASKIGRYLQLPDLEEAYRGSSAVQDAIDKVIELAIDLDQPEDMIDVPNFVNYEQLAQEIAITQNELFGSLTGDKKKDEEIKEKLMRLQALDELLTDKMEEDGIIQTTEADEQMTSDSGIATGATNSAVMANDSAMAMEQVDGMQASPNTDTVGMDPALESAGMMPPII